MYEDEECLRLLGMDSKFRKPKQNVLDGDFLTVRNGFGPSCISQVKDVPEPSFGGSENLQLIGLVAFITRRGQVAALSKMSYYPSLSITFILLPVQ